MSKAECKNNSWIRRFVQIGFFLFVFTIVFSRFIEAGGIEIPWPSVGNFHAICPFGAVETAGRLVMEGSFIPKIHESNLWTFAGVAVLTLLFGPLFCGWLCPLGSVQEWIGGIGKKICKKRYNKLISRRADRILGYMRYGVLALIVYFTTRSMALVFQRFDPYYALFHFWTGDVFFTALLVLGMVLVLSLFFERPWCRWLCPFGALLGLIQLVSPWKIRKKQQTCTGCGVCMESCPMRISIHEKRAVLNTRCNRCMICFDACKRNRTLEYSAGPLGMLPLRRKAFAGMFAVLVFAAPIIFASAAGYYKTSDTQIVKKGRLTIEQIKGSMSIREVAEGIGVGLDTINTILGLPEDVPGETKIYDLEDIDSSLTIGKVRERIDEYKQ